MTTPMVAPGDHAADCFGGRKDSGGEVKKNGTKIAPQVSLTPRSFARAAT